MYKVFGQKGCADCETVVKLLSGKCTFEYIGINHAEGYREFRSYFPTERTVPKVLLMTPNDGDHEFKVIGGLKELREWLNRSTLKS